MTQLGNATKEQLISFLKRNGKKGLSSKTREQLLRMSQRVKRQSGGGNEVAYNYDAAFASAAPVSLSGGGKKNKNSEFNQLFNSFFGSAKRRSQMKGGADSVTIPINPPAMATPMTIPSSTVITPMSETDEATSRGMTPEITSSSGGLGLGSDTVNKIQEVVNSGETSTALNKLINGVKTIANEHPALTSQVTDIAKDVASKLQTGGRRRRSHRGGVESFAEENPSKIVGLVSGGSQKQLNDPCGPLSGGRRRRSKSRSHSSSRRRSQKGGQETSGATPLPPQWYNPAVPLVQGKTPSLTGAPFAYGTINAVSGSCRNLGAAPDSSMQQTGGKKPKSRSNSRSKSRSKSKSKSKSKSRSKSRSKPQKKSQSKSRSKSRSKTPKKGKSFMNRVKALF